MAALELGYGGVGVLAGDVPKGEKLQLGAQRCASLLDSLGDWDLTKSVALKWVS